MKSGASFFCAPGRAEISEVQNLSRLDQGKSWPDGKGVHGEEAMKDAAGKARVGRAGSA